MDGTEKERMVSSFTEITAQSVDIAHYFLQATNWEIDKAVQLFSVENGGGLFGAASSLSFIPLVEDTATLPGQSSGMAHPSAGCPLTGLSSLVPIRNSHEGMTHLGVWEVEENPSSSADTSRNNLASLYYPPFALMYQGPFEKAKQAASVQGKWLLVNIQSTTEFSSHQLNRDTWANEVVAQAITTNFIFWQVYDNTTEGTEACIYYDLKTIPAILVVDPMTGRKMHAWSGMVSPDTLLKDLCSYMASGPTSNHVYLRKKHLRDDHHTSKGTTIFIYVMGDYIFGSVESRLSYDDLSGFAKDKYVETDVSAKYRTYGGRMIILACGAAQIWKPCFEMLNKIASTGSRERRKVTLNEFYLALRDFHTLETGRSSVYIAGFTADNKPHVYVMDYVNEDGVADNNTDPIDIPRDGIITSGTGGDIAWRFAKTHPLSRIELETSPVSYSVIRWIHKAMIESMLRDKDSGGYSTVLGVSNMRRSTPIVKRISALQGLIQFYDDMNFDGMLFLFYDEEYKKLGDDYFGNWVRWVFRARPKCEIKPTSLLSIISKIESTSIILRGFDVGENISRLLDRLSSEYKVEIISGELIGWKVKYNRMSFYVCAPSIEVLRYLRPKMKLLEQLTLAEKQLKDLELVGGVEVDDDYVDPHYLPLDHLHGFMCGEDVWEEVSDLDFSD